MVSEAWRAAGWRDGGWRERAHDHLSQHGETPYDVAARLLSDLVPQGAHTSASEGDAASGGPQPA